MPISSLTPLGEARPAAATASATATPIPVINPLTGLPAPDPALLDRRPLAIKISNYPRDIRPQYGLNEADVVFEYYIEWGYSRFIGIFFSNNAMKIGPVRSGRYFDEHITRMYHAFYVFNFADPREYRYFLGGDLAQFMVVPGGNCDVAPFFTSRGSSVTGDASHFECYFNSARFDEYLARKHLDDSRPELRSTFFVATAPTGGANVGRIFTYYSRCDYNYWDYNPDTVKYLRFQEVPASKDIRYLNECVDNPQTYGPLVDSVTREQVEADNVVVLYASHTFATENEQSDEIYHIDLLDSGRAFVFRDGLGIPARWVRTDLGQPLLLTTLEGAPLGLRPGRTFFEVIGETSHNWSDGNDWHFEFHTP
ncbi:MAG TPA: DUF3048 domain-containing protein [Anaerolineales bacterium]|nr:DUF3048 domain-containing protein [Anaerolineales bacterium]